MLENIPLIAFGFVIALLLTPLIILLAKKFNFYDIPGYHKIHTRKVPYGGGAVIFLAFFLPILFFLQIDKRFIGLFLGALVLLVSGLIDDFHPLGWKPKLSFQMLASLIVVASGMGIEYISNPLGGTLLLNQFNIPILEFSGITYFFSFPADIITIIWVVLMVNALNLLDGLDGLASGVSAIGGIVLGFLSLQMFVNQPVIAALAFLFAAANLGFLPFNFHPAKIFLGDAGSQVLGFILAVLAIFSGGKIATTFLVLAIPVLDILFVSFRRFRSGKPIFSADKQHFHHQLLSSGFSHRNAVLFIYLFSIAAGVSALFLKTTGKIWAMGILFLILLSFSWIIFKPSHETT